MKWKAFIGAGQTGLGRGGVPRRASVPGHLAEHRGVLYYSTNMGVFCAVDAVTGVIAWQSAYEQAPVESGRSSGRRRRRRSRIDSNPTWLPSRPLERHGVVYFAPSDASVAFAADAATGEIRPLVEASPDHESRYRSLVGIHDDLLIVADRRILAVDLDKNVLRWTFPAPDETTSGATVCGLPVIVGNELVCTVRGDESAQVRLDLRTGEVLASKSLEGSSFVGNSVPSSRGMVIGTQESVVAIFD